MMMVDCIYRRGGRCDPWMVNKHELCSTGIRLALVSSEQGMLISSRKNAERISIS